MSERDGGPAFPCHEGIDRYDDERGRYVTHFLPTGGMALRDYFAAKALAGGIHEFFASGDAWQNYDDFVKSCYRIADAMLAERVKL